MNRTGHLNSFPDAWELDFDCCGRLICWKLDRKIEKCWNCFIFIIILLVLLCVAVSSAGAVHILCMLALCVWLMMTCLGLRSHSETHPSNIGSSLMAGQAVNINSHHHRFEFD